MDDRNNLQKALNEVFGKMNFCPADPEEHYAEQVRVILHEAYKAGFIDCIPEVTCHFNRATGEMFTKVKFPPPKTDSIHVDLTF